MNPNDPNVTLLEVVAERLGDDLRDEMVFVGGAVAGLLITDLAMPAIRPTEDVDLVCQAVVLADYHRVKKTLRARGFIQDMRPQAPICRWQIGSVVVDVIPTLEEILGFANRWYPLALETALPVALPSGRPIRLITAPVFLATKLEAFDGRGQGNFLFSHDLGDLLAVVDGRDALREECLGSPSELRVYLAERFQGLLAQPAFMDALPGRRRMGRVKSACPTCWPNCMRSPDFTCNKYPRILHHQLVSQFSVTAPSCPPPAHHYTTPRRPLPGVS